jgi:hypothetical protein
MGHPTGDEVNKKYSNIQNRTLEYYWNKVVVDRNSPTIIIDVTPIL